MALPVKFPESNIDFGKPKGWKDEECSSLPAWVGEVMLQSEASSRKVPTIICCWQLNKEQLDEIATTGRIWVQLYSNQMVPVSVYTENPFNQNTGDNND